ncbi:MAG: AAA family ATPase [Clostridia bacterium]|jgi:DNA repair protein SbcC/Rad50|nr:AAA family ATPase [Clostridia bacterium]
MRIEKVVVQNINSLYGRFTIDFTDPAYSEGLFAIVGPSGSGKSSVLDAMCLALYGRTPRITVSDMHDETMSQNTDICVAEVVFVSGEKRYRSTFEHRRTKRSAKPFMSPKNELFEFEADGTQTTLSDNSTEAKRKVTDIVGLDYDQFTRSVMLAQFKFAEFLSANSTQRAEILEQVSGTDIYRRISMAVFNKQKFYATALDEIRIKRETINVLVPAEVKQIEAELTSIDAAVSGFEALKDKVDESLSTLTQSDKYKTALAEFEAHKQKVVQNVLEKSKVFDEAADEEKKIKLQSKALQKTLVSVRKLDLNISAANKEIGRLRSDSETADKDIKSQKKIILQILTRHLPSADNNELKRIYEADNEADIIAKHISAALKIKEDKQSSLRAEINKTLQSKDETHWRNLQEELERALPLLQAKHAKTSAEQALKKLRKSLTALQAEEKQIDKQIADNQEKFLLAKLTEKYADERSKLNDGQPCPLCGALQHPSAHEHLDTSFVKAAEQEKQQLENKKTSISEDITRIAVDVKAQVNIIADNEDILKGKNALLEKLETAQPQDVQKQTEHIKQLLSQSRQLSEQLALAAESVLNLTRQLNEVDKDVADIKHAKSVIGDLELRKANTEKELAVAGKEKTTLSEQRVQMFGDKDADSEETAANSALVTAEQITRAERKRMEAAKADEVRNKTDIDRSKTQIEALAKKLDQSYSDVLGGAAVVTTLEPTGQTDLYDTVQKQNAALMQTAQQSRETMTDLTGSLFALATKLKESKGEARNKLRENDSKKKQIKELDVQEKDDGKQFKRWNELNALIGSADGIKFSRIAQGITFDVLLQYANESLKKMSDRYILARDSSKNASPLEINVVDNYQAGDIRPVSNLSGGESFVVSMALALGLSEMSSGKTQIDSLFIDEGFASLDENYLELALQTLSTLGNRENKLIGVISHVKELKERIDTQIEVSALTGGRSTLTGPGVSIDERYIL